VLHGNRTYLLQDENGQIIETHSVSAGLDYPGVGPEHAYLKDIGAPNTSPSPTTRHWPPFTTCAAPRASSRRWSPAMRWRYAMKLAATMRPDQHLLVNLSGRGDKDIGTVADLSGAEFFCRPSCRGQSVKGAAALEVRK
jgi:tryptophan synthase beta chain